MGRKVGFLMSKLNQMHYRYNEHYKGFKDDPEAFIETLNKNELVTNASTLLISEILSQKELIESLVELRDFLQEQDLQTLSISDFASNKHLAASLMSMQTMLGMLIRVYGEMLLEERLMEM